MKTLDELSVKHPYYCSESNYYSKNASVRYDTMTDYLDDFYDADIDMNLMFRWDVHKRDNGSYYAEIFLLLQRKGIFRPVFIESISEQEVESFCCYARSHWARLNEMWNPISNNKDL